MEVSGILIRVGAMGGEGGGEVEFCSDILEVVNLVLLIKILCS